jgi:hypothetical protein
MLVLSEEDIISDFDCGDADLNDFCLVNSPYFVRFLLVDAYNELNVIGFYQKNDFTPVFSTEEQEKQAYQQEPDETLRTRYMFYDMIQCRNRLIS